MRGWLWQVIDPVNQATEGSTAGQSGSTLRPVFVVGTRPEAIKIFPIILAMESDPRFDPIVISSGQHPQMCNEMLGLAGILPDMTLALDRRTGSINELLNEIMGQLTEVLERLIAQYNSAGSPPRIPATFVHGDTSTALAGALASTFAGIPVIHVEAGLRTYDLYGPFPEELNRQLIARMAVLSIAPTGPSEGNLIREAIDSELVFVSGNTGVDALLWAVEQPATFADASLTELMEGDNPIVVVTAHRRENWDRLGDIAAAVLRIVEARSDVRVVLPLHPNPRVRERFNELLSGQRGILLTEPLPYVEFAHVLKRATLILTDSGGIQEEAPSLGVPVLVMRDQTERPEGVVAGTLRLVGVDADRIVKESLRLLNDPTAHDRMAAAENPYGDGRASQRIVQALQYVLTGGDPPTPFGPGFSRRAVLDTSGPGFEHFAKQDHR